MESRAAALASPTTRFVMMGVSGAGKSAIGERFARALGVPFVEGDLLHPAENVARMSAGIPLTDADRRGWLEAIAARLAESRRDHHGLVVACSALKRRYRDLLRAADPDVLFVHLVAPPSLLVERLEGREGHFMPVALLESQFDALEPPDADERAWEVNVSPTIDDVVARLVRRAAGASDRAADSPLPP